tara:strand:+ start:1541 stop:1798 length:258 start_codon:yes stop_codon:yes gene_type:complete
MLDRADGAEGRPPRLSGEIDNGTILHNELGLDPVGPIVAPITFTGNYQIEIPSLEFDFDGEQALRVTAFKDSAFVERLRTDTLSQ